MKSMIAYCGLDCEKCDAYLATVNNDQELRKKTAKLWAELNHAPILPEHINCQGCRVEGVKTVFCDRHCNTCNVYLLETVFPEKRYSHVTRNRNDRNGVHICRCDTCHKVRGTRTAGRQTDAHLACSPRIAVCRMGCSLLMGCQNMPDLIAMFVQFIVHIEDRSARISEDGVHPLLFQAFYYYLSSI